MTTIATDGKSMAGDGLCHAHGVIVASDHCKVSRLSDGRLLGTCGATSDGEAFRRWLEVGGGHPDLEDGFAALVLLPDGTVRWYSNKPHHMTPDLPAAIGSGMDLALGAMLVGADPRLAVEIAATRDLHTGGTITVIHREE